MRTKTTYTLDDDFALAAKGPIPPRDDIRYFDKKETGFCLKVHATGRRTWCVATLSAKGRPSLAVLGPVEGPKGLVAVDARKMAKQAKQKAERGQSIAKERAADRKLRKAAVVTTKTVTTLAREWLDNGRDSNQWRPISMSQYERDIKKFVKVFGEHAAADITSPDIQRFYNKLAAQSLSTALNAKNAISAMYGYAIQTHKDIPINPASGRIIKVGTLHARKQKFSDEQIAAIRDALDTVFHNDPGTPFIRLMDISGCRMNEAFNIRPDMIDVRNQGGWWRLRPDEVKQDAYHSYRLNKQNGVEIAMAAAKSPLNRSQRQYRTEQLYKSLTEYLAERGITLPKGRFHLFRKTRVTFLVRNGVPLVAAGKAVGHRHPETTMAYFHPDELDMQELIDAADEGTAYRANNANKRGRKAGRKTTVHFTNVARA